MSQVKLSASFYINLSQSTSVMGRPSWATEEQFEFLLKAAEDYLPKKGDRRSTSAFWSPFFQAWKDAFPDTDLDAEISEVNEDEGKKQKKNPLTLQLVSRCCLLLCKKFSYWMVV